MAQRGRREILGGRGSVRAGSADGSPAGSPSSDRAQALSGRRLRLHVAAGRKEESRTMKVSIIGGGGLVGSSAAFASSAAASSARST